MSTNPGNAIGTNGAYGGRTSVNAFNDHLSFYSNGGIMSGWVCSPSSGLTVQLGGETGTRDIAIATAPDGGRTTINNRTNDPVNVTLTTAPTTNPRIDVIVAYVNNPPQGDELEVDNPGACGLIAVAGTAAASPLAPTDSEIRAAITSDGGVGSSAYYVILASVKVAAGATTITADYITQGKQAAVGTDEIEDEAVTADKIDWTTITKSSLLKHANTTFSVGFGSEGLSTHRYGMFVFVGSIFRWTITPGTGWITLSETIPEGFRPSHTLNASAVGASASSGQAFFEFNPNGIIRIQNNGLDGYYGLLSVAWITDDDFPES